MRTRSKPLSPGSQVTLDDIPRPRRATRSASAQPREAVDRPISPTKVKKARGAKKGTKRGKKSSRKPTEEAGDVDAQVQVSASEDVPGAPVPDGAPVIQAEDAGVIEPDRRSIDQSSTVLPSIETEEVDCFEAPANDMECEYSVSSRNSPSGPAFVRTPGSIGGSPIASPPRALGSPLASLCSESVMESDSPGFPRGQTELHCDARDLEPGFLTGHESCSEPGTPASEHQTCSEPGTPASKYETCPSTPVIEHETFPESSTPPDTRYCFSLAPPPAGPEGPFRLRPGACFAIPRLIREYFNDNIPKMPPMIPEIVWPNPDRFDYPAGYEGHVNFHEGRPDWLLDRSEEDLIIDFEKLLTKELRRIDPDHLGVGSQQKTLTADEFLQRKRASILNPSLNPYSRPTRSQRARPSPASPIRRNRLPYAEISRQRRARQNGHLERTLFCLSELVDQKNSSQGESDTSMPPTAQPASQGESDTSIPPTAQPANQGESDTSTPPTAQPAHAARTSKWKRFLDRVLNLVTIGPPRDMAWQEAAVNPPPANPPSSPPTTTSLPENPPSSPGIVRSVFNEFTRRWMSFRGHASPQQAEPHPSGTPSAHPTQTLCESNVPTEPNTDVPPPSASPSACPIASPIAGPIASPSASPQPSRTYPRLPTPLLYGTGYSDEQDEKEKPKPKPKPKQNLKRSKRKREAPRPPPTDIPKPADQNPQPETEGRPSSPTHIPNPKGCSYGMDMDYFDFTDEEYAAEEKRQAEEAERAAAGAPPPKKPRVVPPGKSQSRKSATKPASGKATTTTRATSPAHQPGFIPNRRGTYAFPELETIESSRLVEEADVEVEAPTPNSFPLTDTEPQPQIAANSNSVPLSSTMEPLCELSIPGSFPLSTSSQPSPPPPPPSTPPGPTGNKEETVGKPSPSETFETPSSTQSFQPRLPGARDPRCSYVHTKNPIFPPPEGWIPGVEGLAKFMLDRSRKRDERGGFSMEPPPARPGTGSSKRKASDDTARTDRQAPPEYTNTFLAEARLKRTRISGPGESSCSNEPLVSENVYKPRPSRTFETPYSPESSPHSSTGSHVSSDIEMTHADHQTQVREPQHDSQTIASEPRSPQLREAEQEIHTPNPHGMPPPVHHRVRALKCEALSLSSPRSPHPSPPSSSPPSPGEDDLLPPRSDGLPYIRPAVSRTPARETEVPVSPASDDLDELPDVIVQFNPDGTQADDNTAADVLDQDPSPLTRARTKAEQFKPKTPSRLREAHRFSSSLNGTSPHPQSDIPPPVQDNQETAQLSSPVYLEDIERYGNAEWLMQQCPTGDMREMKFPPKISLVEDMRAHGISITDEEVAVAQRDWDDPVQQQIDLNAMRDVLARHMIDGVDAPVDFSAWDSRPH